MVALRSLAFLLLGAASAAAAPAELPPVDFAGAQYVDSAGCVFLRDGAGAWQARLTREGRPLCGYAPSVAPAPGPRARAEAAALTIVAAQTVPGTLTNCPNRPITAQRYELSDGRAVMRCAPQTDDPAGFINRAGVPGLEVAGGAPGATALLDIALRQPLPAAPPPVSVAPAAVEPAKAPARAKAAPAKGAERFVQIGAFGDSGNAQKVKARLRALDLPVASSTTKRGGKVLELVFSGPFDAEGAASARDLLRKNGFPEAFVR